MINRILLIGAVALSLSFSAHAQMKVAVIDLQKAFNEYYKTKDAEANLKERMGSIQKEQQEMMGDYQKTVDEINKLRESTEDKTLAESAREEKKKALQIKIQDAANMERKIQEFRTTRARQFEDQSRRMRQGIIEEIIKIVNDTGAKEKYSLVLDKSGLSMNGTSVLLYSSDVKDLTDDVIKTINASKPAAGAAAKPADAKPADKPK
jgi:outer membrane protein